MSDAAKILAERKAAALEAGRRAQEAAQREAAEIDRDLQELARINKKYGLSDATSVAAAVTISDTAPEKPSSSNGVKMIRAVSTSHTSMTMRSRLESAAVIMDLKRPVPLSELHDKIYARGVRLGGKKPAWVLSAILGRTEGFITIKDRGWWLTQLGDPPPVQRADLLGSDLTTRSASH